MNLDNQTNDYIDSQEERDAFLEKIMDEEDLTFNEALMRWEKKLATSLERWDD